MCLVASIVIGLYTSERVCRSSVAQNQLNVREELLPIDCLFSGVVIVAGHWVL